MLSFGTQLSIIPLACSNTAVTISENTTAEKILAIVDVPAGLIGANGKIIGTVAITHTSSANAKTYKVYLGNGSGAVGGSLTANTSTSFVSFAATASTTSCAFDFWIGNRASEAVNAGCLTAVRAAPNSASTVTGTINTAAAGQRIIITATKATGTESVSLESFDIMVKK
jgi:hypothetical protein